MIIQIDILDIKAAVLTVAGRGKRFNPRGASYERVLAVVVCLCVSVCLSVCHTPVSYQNG